MQGGKDPQRNDIIFWAGQYLILSVTPCGTPMLTVADRTLCRLIFLSAPYSTTVPNQPVLETEEDKDEQRPWELGSYSGQSKLYSQKIQTFWGQICVANGKQTAFICCFSRPPEPQLLPSFLSNFLSCEFLYFWMFNFFYHELKSFYIFILYCTTVYCFLSPTALLMLLMSCDCLLFS